MTNVFIDGEQGTTGLQIHDRLRGRSDITLMTLPVSHRHAPAGRDAQQLRYRNFVFAR